MTNAKCKMGNEGAQKSRTKDDDEGEMVWRNLVGIPNSNTIGPGSHPSCNSSFAPEVQFYGNGNNVDRDQCNTGDTRSSSSLTRDSRSDGSLRLSDRKLDTGRRRLCR